MDKITLQKILPEVFASRADIKSDIWQQEVTLEKGHTYLLESNSGTGKSSLCSFIYGYRQDYHGIILFDDKNIRTLQVRDWCEVRKKSIALLWQELRLFPELTAYENVQLKNRLTSFQPSKRIKQWFEYLGISALKDRKVAHLSWGQQQRVAFIRTLCQPFDFIFMDEPISHLDESNSNLIAQLVTDEAARQGAGIIATSIGKRLELNYDTTFQL